MRILAGGDRDGERILSEAVEQFGLNGGRAEGFMAQARAGLAHSCFNQAGFADDIP